MPVVARTANYDARFRIRRIRMLAVPFGAKPAIAHRAHQLPGNATPGQSHQPCTIQQKRVH